MTKEYNSQDFIPMTQWPTSISKIFRTTYTIYYILSGSAKVKLSLVQSETVFIILLSSTHGPGKHAAETC